jgi:hypothetical protein
MSDDEHLSRPSPAAAEREIGGTRMEISRTLDALERKLAARQIVQKGVDMLKDTFADSERLNRGLDIIRANPVPTALIGIGAAWLIASNTNVVNRLASDERVNAARRRVSILAGDIGTRAGELASGVADRIGLGADADTEGEQPLGHTGNSTVDNAHQPGSNGWVHQMTDMAQGAMRSARDSGGAMLSRAGDYAGDEAGRIADQVGDAFDRHPLVLGAVGIMAGALVAALLPVTRVEDEFLGSTRDQLMHKAEDVGQRALTQVREAATRVVDATAEAAAESVKSETETAKNEIEKSIKS